MKNRRPDIRLGASIEISEKKWIRTDVGLAADVEDGESLNDSYQKLFEEVYKQLIVRIETLKGKELGSESEKREDRYRGRRR